MDIASITQALTRDAIWVVFLNVLLQQFGLPIPAVPTLMVAGSLAGWSPRAALLLLAAVLASVSADWLWYLAGRAFGYRVLSAPCRLSINPGSCVTQTEARFLRWGVWSLVVAKFVPGFSSVAPPIAGSLRMPLASFLGAAALGAGLWACGSPRSYGRSAASNAPPPFPASGRPNCCRPCSRPVAPAAGPPRCRDGGGDRTRRGAMLVDRPLAGGYDAWMRQLTPSAPPA